MSYNLDSEHLQMDDSTDIDLGKILNGMEGADLWNYFDEEMAGYDAAVPAFIRQHDFDNVLGGAVDV